MCGGGDEREGERTGGQGGGETYFDMREASKHSS